MVILVHRKLNFYGFTPSFRHGSSRNPGNFSFKIILDPGSNRAGETKEGGAIPSIYSFTVHKLLLFLSGTGFSSGSQSLDQKTVVRH
jgi:hypothetical protein